MVVVEAVSGAEQDKQTFWVKPATMFFTAFIYHGEVVSIENFAVSPEYAVVVQASEASTSYKVQESMGQFVVSVDWKKCVYDSTSTFVVTVESKATVDELVELAAFCNFPVQSRAFWVTDQLLWSIWLAPPLNVQRMQKVSV